MPRQRRTQAEIITSLEEKKAGHLKHIATIDAKIDAVKNRKPVSRKGDKAKILDAIKDDKIKAEVLALMCTPCQGQFGFLAFQSDRY